ncbi:major facilitator superfamily-domain-containing protein [Aspergillus granulosus]|uniref:Major facilitator superfamily-domain-containing protein n=1 Tax=Aspergillus granulosus TaxID=176169 RepID=A0ABR4HDQ0_9EURO
MPPENLPSETSPLLGPQSNGHASYSSTAGGGGGQPDPALAEQGHTEEVDAGKDSSQRALNIRYIFPAISIGVFLSAADQTIIVASYGKIGSDLHALNLTSWIATSYFLTLTSFQPLYGKLSDIFGRKACLLFAYAVFGIGCLGCGLAQNIHHLIAARVFQGIGGGGMTTVVSILLSDIIPLRDRGVWQGVINIIYATGSGIGAPLGGVLSDYIGWRWAFIAQFPLCIIAFIAVSVMLDLPAPEDSHWKAKLRRIDFPGAIILIGAVLGFLIGFDRGSNVSWTMPLTIVSLSVSAFLFVLFVVVEIYYATEPFAPGHIIFDRGFVAAYGCNFFSFGGWLSGLFYLPLYFQAMDGVSATGAAIRLLPCICAGVSGSLFSGFVMRWTGKYYWLTVIGYTLLTLGLTVIFLFSGGVTDSLVPIILGTIACAFGNGIGVTTTLISLISNATPEDQAVVTACSYLFRSLGSVIGLALSSTVVQQVLRGRLREALRNSKDIDRIVDGVRQSLDFIKTLEPDVATTVRDCYGWATNKGFAFLIGSRLTFARYRPLFYLLSGVAAAYALVYLRNHIFSSSPSQSSLRRRKAVRRQRRNDSDTAGPTDTPSFRAIAHLEQLERQNGVYGTFRIETEDGRRVESGLLPSLLATRDQLMEEVGVPQAHAERMREMMEDTFLESFFALDFPSTHVLEEGSPERIYLTEQLRRRGISRSGIERAVERFNADENYGEELRRRRQNGERVTLSTSTFPDEPQQQPVMDGGETVVDDQSVFSWREGNNDSTQAREGQNLLNLLYHIAEDQARKDGYIHRGVTCNSCGAMPIQGIRYRCANCIDYDLCETCEAMQVHIKTHLFYKVRIPAPFLGNPRQSQPVWYPGKPSMLPRTLPRSLVKRLMKETGFEGTELEALWDQFRCLANREWSEDPNKLYMAIDRKTFDRCFVPNTSVRPPPPSLIYDRMFAFYDTNNDGLIGFEEFLKGLASLNNKSNDERLRRVFRGYDIDGDGYVERKDFLRVFRAYYTLSRELTRDMVAGMEDDFLEGGARDVVLGSQPISSAFPGSIPSGENSRIGEGKRVNQEGDMEVVDSDGVLRPDGADTGDRHSVVGEAAVRRQFGRSQPILPVTVRASASGSSAAEASSSQRRRESRDDNDDEDGDDDEAHDDEDADASEPEYESQPPSPRSRSSSKVRFQDDLTDDGDCDARSNPSTSSRSILVGERWGGFEVPEVERDVGKEILYQVTQQGFNEILDIMFKPKEDLLMECYRTRTERKIWAREIELAEQLEASNNNRENVHPGSDRGQEEESPLSRYQTRPLDELLERAGYSIGSPVLGSAQGGPILAPPAQELRLPVHEDNYDSSNSDDDDLRPTHLSNPEEPGISDLVFLSPQNNLILSPTPHPHSPSIPAMDEDEPPIELDPDYDPTLPHHRPNDDSILPLLSSQATTTLPPSPLRLHPNNTVTTFPAPTSPEAETTAPKRAPSPIQPLPAPSLSHSPSTLPTRQGGPTTPPPQATLSRWAYLNRVEAEAKERGGTGAKLNFEEFSRRMAADRGRKLAFVATWIEMASF